MKCWKDQFTSQLSPGSAQCFANGFPDVNIKEIRNDYKPLVYASWFRQPFQISFLNFCFSSMKTWIHSILNHSPIQKLIGVFLGKSEKNCQVVFCITHPQFPHFFLSSQLLPEWTFVTLQTLHSYRHYFLGIAVNNYSVIMYYSQPVLFFLFLRL